MGYQPEWLHPLDLSEYSARSERAYNQNKKIRFKTSYSCFDRKASKHHNKTNSKQGKLAGEGGGGISRGGLTTNVLFWVGTLEVAVLQYFIFLFFVVYLFLV